MSRDDDWFLFIGAKTVKLMATAKLFKQGLQAWGGGQVSPTLFVDGYPPGTALCRWQRSQ